MDWRWLCVRYFYLVALQLIVLFYLPTGVLLSSTAGFECRCLFLSVFLFWVEVVFVLILNLFDVVVVVVVRGGGCVGGGVLFMFTVCL